MIRMKLFILFLILFAVPMVHVSKYVSAEIDTEYSYLIFHDDFEIILRIFQ